MISILSIMLPPGLYGRAISMPNDNFDRCCLIFAAIFHKRGLCVESLPQELWILLNGGRLA